MPDRKTAHLMKRTIVTLLLGMMAAGTQAQPPSPPTPAELDIPYSPDNPPGPTFTDDEKRQQLVDGQRIRSEIVAAFKAERESYTIPPGNYRFDSAYKREDGNSFALKGLHGDPAKPFRILGYGATLWFNLTDRPMPHYHHMIKIFECSHITLEGVTVDSDPRSCMDATITAFDFDRNRIQVRPVAGTRLLERPPASDPRFIPYKANGHHIAALYSIDEGWGPGHVTYDSFERTADGLYWFTMKTTKLLDTVRNDAWRSAYGPEGTLEIGDVLGVLYSTSGAINLLNCKQITVRDCRFHAAKAGLVEQHGYGDHRWINCSFMARPGTNNLLGGDGVMSSCMHGSTFERRVVRRTTDDCFNSHGHWHHAESVAERSITFRKTPSPHLASGHIAEAYDTRNDTFIGRLTVERVEGKTVTFREPVGERYAKAGLIFPAFQNAGWAIRDSIFTDCYQRVRLMCGPGTFENNRIERIGAGLTLETGKAVDPEGGLPDNVIIRNNVFVDSAVAPPMRAIFVKGRGPQISNLEISGNLICNSGSEAVHVTNANHLVLRDNIMIHPVQGQALLPKGKAPPPAPAAVALQNVQDGTIAGNLLLRGPAACDFLRTVQCVGISSERNPETTDEQRRLEHVVRGLMEAHDLTAAEIIAEVRARVRTSGGLEPSPR